MSNARRAARQLLNNDWSRAVWKHWLANIFEPPVEPPAPASAAAPPPAVALASEPSGELLRPQPATSCASPKHEPPDSAGLRDVRRSEVRARFDALGDRLSAVEDGLDTLLRRSAQREKLDRRTDLQSVEMIDHVALASERQATALESLLGTVTRLEQGMARLEHGLGRLERALGERQRRESFSPPPSQPPRAGSQFPESQPGLRERTSNFVRSVDVDELDAQGSAGIHGNLSEVSLSTVMAMLEIERHTGRLKVATDDGVLASFELCEGSVMSSRLSENDADPLHTLRAALCWKQGRFWFRQQPLEAPSYPPRSIGSLLLEATRQNDESFANVG